MRWLWIFTALGYVLVRIIVNGVLPSNVPASTLPQSVETPVPQAASPAVSPAVAPEVIGRGKARICANRALPFDKYNEIRLPVTTVFEDEGPFEGELGGEWNQTIEARRKADSASFMTTEVVSLTKARPCGEAEVRMFVDGRLGGRAVSARFAAHHLWTIKNVVDYKPGLKPKIEIGTLISDVSVRAQLLTDAGDPHTAVEPELSEAEQTAKCHAAARSIASQISAGAGDPSPRRVGISHPSLTGMAYECDAGRSPFLNMFWKGARPRSAAEQVVVKAGSILTGAPQAEMRELLSRCIREALKPDAMELADVEYDGVRIECQSFTRDGGAGGATIFRRFGASPALAAPTGAASAELERASAKMRADAEQEAAQSRAFVEWMQDSKVPHGVKSALMLISRVVLLSQRCPTWKGAAARVAAAAKGAGITPQDIQPGGRYFETFVIIGSSMKAGMDSEPNEDACRIARESYSR